jgi:hypothetical protein
MNQLYELTTLSFPLLAVSEVFEGALAYVTDSNAIGELIGGWRTEIGTLGRLLILRGFETAKDLATERKRALLGSKPFNGGRRGLRISGAFEPRGARFVEV